MQENLKVFRLGPNFKIESGVIFQLFLGSIRASHIGLNGGIIFAAAVDYPDDIKSNKKSYKKIPEGSRYLYFFRSCEGTGTFHYDSLSWIKEPEEGSMPVLLIGEKPRPVGTVSLYKHFHGSMKKGGNRRV
jgi:hypothetical protein